MIELKDELSSTNTNICIYSYIWNQIEQIFHIQYNCLYLHLHILSIDQSIQKETKIQIIQARSLIIFSLSLYIFMFSIHIFFQEKIKQSIFIIPSQDFVHIKCTYFSVAARQKYFNSNLANIMRGFIHGGKTNAKKKTDQIISKKECCIKNKMPIECFLAH